ncbi:MAG: PilZ domain-containing protein [Planctomycetota bacterium]
MTDPKTLIKECRAAQRLSLAHRAVILDARGRAVARGHTSNISACGALLVVPWREELLEADEVLVEIDVPKVAHGQVRRGQHRTVRYRCRVARTRGMGQLLGVGVEFIEKLA